MMKLWGVKNLFVSPVLESHHIFQTQGPGTGHSLCPRRLQTGILPHLLQTSLCVKVHQTTLYRKAALESHRMCVLSP